MYKFETLDKSVKRQRTEAKLPEISASLITYKKQQMIFEFVNFWLLANEVTCPIRRGEDEGTLKCIGWVWLPEKAGVASA